ncbi:unnamed protein product [Closterium sp. Naga37s-1]|nr:unnamed protein product [Closterium sp. Naga37s-1]
MNKQFPIALVLIPPCYPLRCSSLTHLFLPRTRLIPSCISPHSLLLPASFPTASRPTPHRYPPLKPFAHCLVPPTHPPKPLQLPASSALVHRLIPLCYPPHSPLLPSPFPLASGLIPPCFGPHTPLLPPSFPFASRLIPPCYPPHSPLLPPHSPSLPASFPLASRLIPPCYPPHSPLLPPHSPSLPASFPFASRLIPPCFPPHSSLLPASFPLASLPIPPCFRPHSPLLRASFSLATPHPSIPHTSTSIASNLRNNLLTGKVLEPVPPNVKMYKLDNNYLSEGFSSPPPCGQGYITYHSNCAATPAEGLACDVDESQKADPVCSAFCGVSPTDPPCNGHGVCFLDGPSSTPTCLCDDNYVIGEFPGSCVAVAGGKTEQNLTPTAATLTATGDASVDAATATLTLTPAQPSKAGSVFLVARVPLFSYQLIGDSCGRELAFSSSFSFTLTRPAASGSEGFAFVVAFDATPPTTPVAGGMGYAGMGARSVAVEFDTSMDARNSDPDSSHVGINTGGNATSVVTSSMSTPLNDGTPKHVWIDYDPSSDGSLRVFLSSHASPRPTTPLLSARISLCEELAPSPSEYTFAIDFTAASGAQPQTHVVSAWTLSTTRGFTFSEAALSLSGMNLFFRYASSGSAAPVGGNDVYGLVLSRLGSGDCWAYAVVGSIEAALSILSNTSAAPVLSVEQLKAAMKVGCSGSTPSQAFQLLLKLARKGGGLVLESQGPAEKGKKAVVKAGSSSPLCSPLLKPLAKLLGVACGKGSDSVHACMLFHSRACVL